MRTVLILALSLLSQLSLASHGFRCETAPSEQIHFGASFVFSGEEGTTEIIQAQIQMKGSLLVRNDFQEFDSQGNFKNISSINWTLHKKEIQMVLNNNIINGLNQLQVQLNLGSFSSGSSEGSLKINALGYSQQLKLKCFEQ